MDVCCECCEFAGRGLADHSSRGVLPSVVCPSECDCEASIVRRACQMAAVRPCG